MNTIGRIITLGALCASGLLETVHAAEPTPTPTATLVSAKVPLEPKTRGSLGFLNTKISFISRSDDKALNRHYTPFSGPPGPTLPYGANLNPTKSGNEPSVIRYAGSSKPFIYDFPPGAKIRQVTVVTQ